MSKPSASWQAKLRDEWNKCIGGFSHSRIPARELRVPVNRKSKMNEVTDSFSRSGGGCRLLGDGSIRAGEQAVVCVLWTPLIRSCRADYARRKEKGKRPSIGTADTDPRNRPSVRFVCKESAAHPDKAVMQNEYGLKPSSRQLPLRWILERPFGLPVHRNTRLHWRGLICVTEPIRDCLRRLALTAGLLLGAVVFAGCSLPAVRQQRLVAKPNMTFADSAAFTYNSPKLLPQLAPGFAASGGAQNSGCTSCR